MKDVIGIDIGNDFAYISIFKNGMNKGFNCLFSIFRNFNFVFIWIDI